MVCLAAALLVTSAPAARAAPGDLDTSFSGDGITTNAFSTGSHVAIDAQGRIVVGGQVMPGRVDAGRPGIVRYTDAGRFDRSFDGDGRMSLPGSGSVRGIATRGSRVVVLTGSALWRLLPDGSPDATFGVAGKVSLPEGHAVVRSNSAPGGDAHPMIATRDRIYVVLRPSSGPDALFTYSAAGRLLGSTAPVTKLSLSLTSIALHGDHLYAVGISRRRLDATRVELVRFTTAGAFDSSYAGGRGIAHGPAIVYDEYGYVTSYTPKDLDVHPASGKVTIVGSKYDCFTGDCSSFYYGFAMRFTAAGRLDLRFGTAGEARAGCTNGSTGMTSTALQGRRAIVGGTAYDKWEEGEDFLAVVRLRDSGARDGSFDTSLCWPGIAGTARSYVEDLLLAGGKVVAVGGPFTVRVLAG